MQERENVVGDSDATDCSSSCWPHEWVKEYYGDRCAKCGQFVPDVAIDEGPRPPWWPDDWEWPFKPD